MYNIAKQWLDADYDLRVRFQAVLFPEGATFDMEIRHFGTDKISPLHVYIPNKKDLSVIDKSLLVSHVVTRWNTLLPILVEMAVDLGKLGFRYSDSEDIYIE